MKKLSKMFAIMLALAVSSAFAIPVHAATTYDDAPSYTLDELREIYDNVTVEPENPANTLAVRSLYKTTLEMSANSFHQGSMRSFDEGAYLCGLYNMDMVDWDPEWEEGYDYVTLEVGLVEGNGITGYRELGSQMQRIDAKYSTKVFVLGRHEGGNRAFTFRTSSSGVYCNNVQLSS